jgi:hypothetical protein
LIFVLICCWSGDQQQRAEYINEYPLRTSLVPFL